jgi:GR25 family glycosyltransferase involved in LPS biosynthesis
MSTNIKAYILSVKESDRRHNAENLKTQIELIGISTKIIDAYYFLETDVISKLYEDGCYYDSPNKTVSQSQIGCFLSHREAWKQIATDPDPNIRGIIIEDDMVLDNSNNTNDLVDFLEESSSNSDALVLWKHPEQYNKTKIVSHNENLLEFYFQWGLCVYCISQNTAQKLLEIQRVYDPVDLMVFRDVFPNLRVFFSKQEYFLNMGSLAGDKTSRFESLIWGKT